MTADAWQNTYGGNGDAFLVKLSPDGQVLFSTFIGGAKSDFGNAIVLVEDEPIVGGTSDGDGFVQRGPSRRAAFGGTGEEKLTGIAHYKRTLYATGYTKSKDWKTLRGTTDAFVVRLNAQTLAIERAEYFGGSGDDSAWGIAVDRRGRVFIAGQSDSPDLPRANRGYQKSNRGGVDAFVARIGGPTTWFGGSQRTRPATTVRTSQSMPMAMSGLRVSPIPRTSRRKVCMAEVMVTRSSRSSIRRWTEFASPHTAAAEGEN